MAKRKKRSARAASPILLVALLALAVIAGCTLLRPTRAPHPSQHAETHPVANQTPVAATTSAPTLAPPTPVATASPLATSSSSATTTPSANPNAPKLALIIDDCGQWLDTERGFIALPIPLTLSVLPDVRYTTLIANEASTAGKGVMLHLPMETISGLNPGPGKVTTEMTDAQIDAQVRADLAQVPLARGVNNHEGSKASSDARVMRDVSAVIAAHGDLFFIDSKTAPTSVAQQEASAAGIPTASRDVFLDNVNDEAAVTAQLQQAAAKAQRDGSAIAIGHPRPATLAAVKAAIPALEAQGVQFVLAGSLTH